MFRISDFSRLTRVTIKALRHYDRLGLLVPAHVDPATRYRHYAARQVTDLQRILALKELGFSLEHIRDLLEQERTGPALVRALESRRLEIARDLEIDRRRLSHVEARLAELESGRAAHVRDAAIREITPVRVASRRARVARLDDGAEELFEVLERDVAEADIRSDGAPILIYHDRDHREADADIEVAVPVLTDARVAGRFRIRTLAAIRTAACVVYAGSYDQWPAVTRELAGWMQSRRLAPTGPMREVFLQFGTRDSSHQIPHAYLVDADTDRLTEVQIPVKSGGHPRVGVAADRGDDGLDADYR
jgi:DNA-binding transcriptional MerR regulator